jgi:hypothetical protein
MATHEQCPEYENCGFVKWRRERPDLHAVPLPEDGDCGIDPEKCMRLHLNRAPKNLINKLMIETYGPATNQEMEVSLPEIYTKNGRSSRIVGGGNQ